MGAEQDIRDSLTNTLFNLDRIAKARCFSGKNIRFSFSVGNDVPLGELVDFVERQSADLAQQVAGLR